MRGLRNCKQSKGTIYLVKSQLVRALVLILTSRIILAVLWQAYFHLEMLVATDMLLRRQSSLQVDLVMMKSWCVKKIVDFSPSFPIT